MRGVADAAGGQALSAVQTRGGGPVTLVDLSPVSWTAGGELPYEEWLRAGSRLGLAGRSAAWWIGDWVRYGTARYGEKYTAAARVTGYDRQTLMNMVYVATRFDTSRRRENLSWSHHAEVASLETGDQEHWLDRASADRLSVRDLRGELSFKGARSATGSAHLSASSSTQPARALERQLIAPQSEAQGPAEKHSVACPQCGHTFVP